MPFFRAWRKVPGAEGVRVMLASSSNQTGRLAHRGGASLGVTDMASDNYPSSASRLGLAAGAGADDDAVSIDEGIARAFGVGAAASAAGRGNSSGAGAHKGGPDGILKGLVLWGTPPFQKRVLIAGRVFAGVSRF